MADHAAPEGCGSSGERGAGQPAAGAWLWCARGPSVLELGGPAPRAYFRRGRTPGIGILAQQAGGAGRESATLGPRILQQRHSSWRTWERRKRGLELCGSDQKLQPGAVAGGLRLRGAGQQGRPSQRRQRRGPGDRCRSGAGCPLTAGYPGVGDAARKTEGFLNALRGIRWRARGVRGGGPVRCGDGAQPGQRTRPGAPCQAQQQLLQHHRRRCVPPAVPPAAAAPSTGSGLRAAARPRPTAGHVDGEHLGRCPSPCRSGPRWWRPRRSLPAAAVHHQARKLAPASPSLRSRRRLGQRGESAPRRPQTRPRRCAASSAWPQPSEPGAEVRCVLTVFLLPGAWPRSPGAAGADRTRAGTRRRPAGRGLHARRRRRRSVDRKRNSTGPDLVTTAARALTPSRVPAPRAPSRRVPALPAR